MDKWNTCFSTRRSQEGRAIPVDGKRYLWFSLSSIYSRIRSRVNEHIWTDCFKPTADGCFLGNIELRTPTSYCGKARLL
jgi:hypothetical protein